jgi:hypothetical protein
MPREPRDVRVWVDTPGADELAAWCRILDTTVTFAVSVPLVVLFGEILPAAWFNAEHKVSHPPLSPGFPPRAELQLPASRAARGTSERG